MSKTSTFTTTRQDSFDSPVLQRVLEQEINGSNSAPSPLRKFRLGKLQIAGLFDRLKTLVGKSGEFLSTCHVEADDFQKEQKELADFASQVNKIADLLIRDHMKVVFVGQTSNGKSTVVNAMLYNRILPSGIGHTTNCFLSVEGSDSDTPHIIDGDIKQDISTLKQLASALHPEGASNESRCIRVFWPTSKCKLLGDDVILVDSPGLDLSTNVNQWIDDYCMDADVFVLVANAESTIRMAERTFFLNVNEKLSKPNIFILNNRWDASDNDGEMEEGQREKVKSQHLEYAAAFLCDELQVVSRSKINDRVYFVSAKEAVNNRTTQDWAPIKKNAEIQARYEEFNRFEAKFAECITKSAMKTKFEHRIIRGLEISYNILEVMEKIQRLAREQIAGKLKDIAQKKARLDKIRKYSAEGIAACQSLIDHLSQSARDAVARAMSEEIESVLPQIVSEFNYCVFRPPHLLQYKRMLNEHIEQHLGGNLNKKCASKLIRSFDDTRNEMLRTVSLLLTVQEPQALENGTSANTTGTTTAASTSTTSTSITTTTTITTPTTATPTKSKTGATHNGNGHSFLTNGHSASASLSSSSLSSSSSSSLASSAAASSSPSLRTRQLLVLPPILQSLQSQKSIASEISLVEFNLDCKGLSDNFEEDIDFHFSMGWHSLGPKVFGPRLYPIVSIFLTSLTGRAQSFVLGKDQQSLNYRNAAALASGSSHSNGALFSNSNHLNTNETSSVASKVAEFSSKDTQLITSSSSSSPSLSLPSSTSSSSSVSDSLALSAADRFALVLATPSSYAVLTVAATILTRPGSWKLLFFTAAAFGGLYAYERALYNNTAKEKKFKVQFIRHATAELRHSIRQISHTVSCSFKARLGNYLDELKQAVSQTESDLIAEIAQSEKEVQRTQAAINTAVLLFNEATYIRQALTESQETFIDANASNSEPEDA